MNSILVFLKKYKKTFKITDIIKDEDTGKITHIYFKNKVMYFLIVAPHSGNEYSYLFRANCKATFDRWSVCDIEYYFTSYLDVLDLLYDGMKEIYINALEILQEDYKELSKQLEEIEDKFYNKK